MDSYDPATAFSAIDELGRYAYAKSTGHRAMESRPVRRDPAAAGESIRATRWEESLRPSPSSPSSFAAKQCSQSMKSGGHSVEY